LQCEIDREREATIDAEMALRNLVSSEDNILAERGEQDILHDAFQDGSSVICTNCGGLVQRSRWDNHRQYWCDSSTDKVNGDGLGNDEDSD
jgi:hypothetical protein